MHTHRTTKCTPVTWFSCVCKYKAATLIQGKEMKV